MMDDIQYKAIVITIAVLTCITNGVFVFTLGRHKHLQTVANVMLASLAVTDFAAGILTLMMYLGLLSRTTDIDTIFTTFMGVLLSFLSFVSIIHLLSITIERYCAIIYPFKYSHLFTKRKLAAILATVWLFPVLYVPVYFSGRKINQTDSHIGAINGSRSRIDADANICSLQAIVAQTILMLVFVVMVILQLRIFWVALKQIRKIRATQPGINCDTAGVRKEIKAFFVSMVVVYYFAFSFLPFSALSTARCSGKILPIWMCKISGILAYVNPVGNPVIYGLSCRDVRKALQMKLCSRIRTRKGRIGCTTNTVTQMTG